jgi:hypothetical protein
VEKIPAVMYNAKFITGKEETFLTKPKMVKEVKYLPHCSCITQYRFYFLVCMYSKFTDIWLSFTKEATLGVILLAASGRLLEHVTRSVKEMVGPNLSFQGGILGTWRSSSFT